LDYSQDIIGLVKVIFLIRQFFYKIRLQFFCYGLLQSVTICLNVLACVLAILFDRLVAKVVVVGYYRRVWV